VQDGGNPGRIGGGLLQSVNGRKKRKGDRAPNKKEIEHNEGVVIKGEMGKGFLMVTAKRGTIQGGKKGSAQG